MSSGFITSRPGSGAGISNETAVVVNGVVMVSLGLGMNLSQEAMLAEMGDLTIINVMNYGRNENGEKSVLDDAAVAQIQAMDRCPPAVSVHDAAAWLSLQTTAG